MRVRAGAAERGDAPDRLQELSLGAFARRAFAGPALASVDLDALRANFAIALRWAGARALTAVVKADAYGHGARPVAAALAAAGCRRLAVVHVEEAVELREAGIEIPILVLGGAHGPGEAEAAIGCGAILVAHHEGHVALAAAAAARLGRRAPLHVEIDTGMRRMGTPPGRAHGLFDAIRAEPALELVGALTQLARADERDLAPTRRQLATFAAVLRGARRRGVALRDVHVFNSAGLLALPELAAAVPGAGARPGVLLYGVSPADHFRAPLQGVMTLRTRVVRVERVGRGTPVGYGARWRARRACWLATLAIGYADGVVRASERRGSALLRGRRVPFAGRVSMDYVTVEAGEGPVEVGDEVILFGGAAECRLPVEEAARAAGTIPHELLVRVGSRVRREYVGRIDCAPRR
jgi:alanine racemase